MNPRHIATLLITVPLTLVACGGDDEGGDSGSLGSGDDFSVAAALGEVPAIAEDGVLQVSTADLVAATEAAAVERPDGAADPNWYEWLNAISGGVPGPGAPVFVAPPDDVMQNTRDPSALDESVGFSFFDADAFVTASLPPTRFTVHAGADIAEADLDGDLVEVTDGVVSTDDRPDFEVDAAADSPADRLGRSVRYAQRDGRIAASLSTPMAEAWVAGEGETLADDESLAAVATALDDAGVVSAMLFRFGDDGPGLDPRANDEARAELAAIGLPEPFGSLGLGWRDDDGDAVITAAYDFGDADTADGAVEVVGTAFREGTTFETIQPIADLLEVDAVESDDRVVVVTLSLGPEGRAATPVEMVHRRDLPFASR